MPSRATELAKHGDGVDLSLGFTQTKSSIGYKALCMLEVIFSHGKESGPWGTKIRQLANTAQALGCQVTSLDYRDSMDPDVRAGRLATYLADKVPQRTLLVGSSMGGYVTLQASKQFTAAGVFVLAPAIYMPGYEHNAPSSALHNLVIVHGWQDRIIPVEHSIQFAQQQQCTLHLLDDDHRLIEHLPTIDAWFKQFVERTLANLSAC